MNFCVIIHYLLVSCKKKNNSSCSLVIELIYFLIIETKLLHTLGCHTLKPTLHHTEINVTPQNLCDHTFAKSYHWGHSENVLIRLKTRCSHCKLNRLLESFYNMYKCQWKRIDAKTILLPQLSRVKLKIQT